MNDFTKFFSIIALLVCLGACNQEQVNPPTTPPTKHASPPASLTLPSGTSSISEESLLPVELPLPEQALAWKIPDSRIRQIFYSPDGRNLAIVGSDVFIYEVDTLELVKKLPDSQDIQSATWSPDGRFIAGGTADGFVLVWDVSTNTKSDRFEVDTMPVKSLMWSPNEDLLSVVAQGTPSVWDPIGRKDLLKLDVGTDYYSTLVWSPDGKQLAGGSSQHGLVTLWTIENGKQLLKTSPLPALTDETPWITWINALAWSPDGKWIAGGLGSNTTSGQSLVVVYDPTNGQQQRTLITPIDPTQIQGIETDPGVYHAPFEIDAIAWSPNSKWLVTGLFNGMVRLWDISGDKPLTGLDNLGVGKSIAWSPDGRTIAISTYEGVLIFWDIGHLQE